LKQAGLAAIGFPSQAVARWPGWVVRPRDRGIAGTPLTACGPSPFFFIFANRTAPYVEPLSIAVPSGRRLNSRVESNFTGKATYQAERIVITSFVK
jgi:hypothetical protein